MGEQSGERQGKSERRHQRPAIGGRNLNDIVRQFFSFVYMQIPGQRPII